MAGRRYASLRLVAALTAAAIAAPVMLAQAQQPRQPATGGSGGAELTEPTTRLDAATARVEAARAEVDAVSAELSGIRSRIERADDLAERDALELEEQELQDRKDQLLRRQEAEEATLARLVAERDRKAEQDQDPGAGAEGPQAPSDAPIVILPGLAAADAASSAPSVTAAATPSATPASISPTPLGADAAARIDQYLGVKGSPMTGLGNVFVNEAAAVGLDPRFLVAISGAETSFGNYGPSQAIQNPFGLGPGMRFASWSDAIHRAAQNLAGRYYLAEGRVTISAIQGRWAPHGASNDPTGLNSNWTRNVSTYYAELGGDPSASVFTGVPTPQVLSQPTIPTTGRAGALAAQDALRLLGTPHPEDREGGLDAADLIQVVYARNGVTLPATIAGQSRAGRAVAHSELQAGDAVFFSTPQGKVVHGGLYLGDGQFVHAPGPGDTVGIGSLYEEQWGRSYAGARRY